MNLGAAAELTDSQRIALFYLFTSIATFCLFSVLLYHINVISLNDLFFDVRSYQKMERSDVSTSISTRESTILVWKMMVFIIFPNSLWSASPSEALDTLV